MREVKNGKQEFYDFLSDSANQEKFYRLAYSYVKEKEAALDVVQDAVVNALKGYENLREKSFLKTWFYRILVNASINYIRKNKKYVLTEEMEEQKAEPQMDTVGKMDLYHAIQTLPDQLRSIVILRFFEDMKLADIAEIMSAPESTIKTRLRSALKQLFNKMEGDYYEHQLERM